MKLNQSGIDFIKKHEGWRDSVYLDSAGLETIGYGHLLKSGESFDGTITKQQGESLLLHDVSIAEKAVNDLVGVVLNQNQFNALVSFTFNLGRGNFEESTLLRLINDGNFGAAMLEFDRWVHAGGKMISGLVARRKKEAELFVA